MHSVELQSGILPFELLILEVLLHETSEYFYRKIGHLNWMMDAIINNDRSAARFAIRMDQNCK